METKKREIVIEEAYFAPRWEPYYQVFAVDGERETLLGTFSCLERAQEHKSKIRQRRQKKNKG